MNRWPSSSREIGGQPALLWATIAALGVLWIGAVSLLAPVARRKVAGALWVTVAARCSSGSIGDRSNGRKRA